MQPNLFFLFSFLSLCAIAALSVLDRTLRHYHLEKPIGEILRSRPLLKLHRLVFKRSLYEGLLFSLAISLTSFRFVFVLLATLGIWTFPQPDFPLVFPPLATVWLFFLFSSFFFFMILGEFFFQWVASHYPEKALRVFEYPASFCLLLTSPLSFFLAFVCPWILSSYQTEGGVDSAKRSLIAILQKMPFSDEMTLHEKKLIESVLRFRERIAREVMVPRVDIFALPAETSILEAVEQIGEEGYSRIPVFKNTIDEVVGILMYKDLLHLYHQYSKDPEESTLLSQSIESITKPTLFTPETKKISNLLLEFRKKQTHLAIVVDEYGGTAGVVTIEDTLEEIVGEIEDEYDVEEELYFPQKDGSWILDARMNILEIEQQLGIKIPQEGDYDTIGGYIFHCAGSIPSRGFVTHQEGFQLEVLRSDERKIKRVRLTPSFPSAENVENTPPSDQEGEEKRG